MFYVETKDGEKFFTSSNSDDVAEFAKILENKMGKDMAKLFLEILEEKVSSVELYYTDGDGIYTQIEPYETAINSAIWSIKDILCRGRSSLPAWTLKALRNTVEELETYE